MSELGGSLLEEFVLAQVRFPEYRGHGTRLVTVRGNRIDCWCKNKPSRCKWRVK